VRWQRRRRLFLSHQMSTGIDLLSDEASIEMFCGVRLSHGAYEGGLIIHERWYREVKQSFRYWIRVPYSQYAICPLFEAAAGSAREEIGKASASSAFQEMTELDVDAAMRRRAPTKAVADDVIATAAFPPFLYVLLSVGTVIYSSKRGLKSMKTLIKRSFDRYEAEKMTRLGFGSAGLTYDGSASPIDGFAKIGIRETKSDEFDASDFGAAPDRIVLHFAFASTPQSIASRYSISSMDIARIATLSLARRITFLGSTYYYDYKLPTWDEYGIGSVAVVPLTDACSILAASLQGLRDMIEHPSHILLEPPHEGRTSTSISAKAFKHISPTLQHDLAELIGRGCFIVAVCHPSSGYATQLMHWLGERKERPIPAVVGEKAVPTSSSKKEGGDETPVPSSKEGGGEETPVPSSKEGGGEETPVPSPPPKKDPKSVRSPPPPPPSLFFDASDIDKTNPSDSLRYVHLRWTKSGKEKMVTKGTGQTRFGLGTLAIPLIAAATFLLEEQGLLTIDEKIDRLLTHTTSGTQRFSWKLFSHLSSVIEKATGLSWPQAMKKTLFDPFGMRETEATMAPPVSITSTATDLHRFVSSLVATAAGVKAKMATPLDGVPEVSPKIKYARGIMITDAGRYFMHSGIGKDCTARLAFSSDGKDGVVLLSDVEGLRM